MGNRVWLILGLCLLLIPQGCSSQKQLIEGEEETVVTERLQYYLYFPEDYEEDDKKRFPLLLFLHGGGESGDSLAVLKKNGPPKMLDEGKQFPFMVLAPQNPHKKQWWNVRAVIQLLDTITTHHRVDPKRIYLSGLSRGGSAAWELAVQYPDRFAALAVVCGMAPVPYASWINKDLPIWVFHGTEDRSIPFSESDTMVAALRQMGYDVTFTAYEGVGHNSWEQAYQTEALYDWMMEQKLD
ncbi:prolyl oligopeptidase family serine peptidase [Muriicola soli]|uniref:Alpha/beta hydrolase n=1 Tax=Muriicola soli TaxID=2507538 RepID=A0A411E801_9FLAO|nr:PHB depolymerase family esterase [Muriicola soli]QBA63836.1 alpha/beta hydrolase [Muriicola soli]